MFYMGKQNVMQHCETEVYDEDCSGLSLTGHFSCTELIAQEADDSPSQVCGCTFTHLGRGGALYGRMASSFNNDHGEHILPVPAALDLNITPPPLATQSESPVSHEYTPSSR